LALVNADEPFVVSPQNILYKCGWSPLEGIPLKGQVTHTWVNGKLSHYYGGILPVGAGKRVEFY